MPIPSRILRLEMELLKPFVDNCSIDTVRLGQRALGELMAHTHKNKVNYSPVEFDGFDAELITPKTEKKNAVILYLHGGGYVAGDIDYARGFGTILCAKNGIKVFCAVYRLAPEYKYPAALDDSLEAYRYLLSQGYSPEKIILCGESAGGGLVYALIMKLNELLLPLPAGIIALSPWTDLTLSGTSYDKNRKNDPSLTRERLSHYADLYCEDKTDPFVSPLFGKLEKVPPSLIFVGSDEILLDDSVLLDEKLRKNGNISYLNVTPDMWHVYILFGTKESVKDHIRIAGFIDEVLNEPN